MRHSNIFGMTLSVLIVLAIAQTTSAQCGGGQCRVGGGYAGRAHIQPAPAGVYAPAPVAYPQVTQYPQPIQYPQAIQFPEPIQSPSPTVQTELDSPDLFGNSETSVESDNGQYGIYVTNPLSGEEVLFKTVTGLNAARSVQSQLEKRFFVMYLDAGQQKYKEARSEVDSETVKQDLRAGGYRVTSVAKMLVRIGNSGEDSLDGLFQPDGQQPADLNGPDLSQSAQQGSASQAPSQTKPAADTMQLLTGTWSAPGKIGASELGVIQLKLLSSGYTTLTFRSANGEESVHNGQASLEGRRLKLTVAEEEVDFGTIESMDQNSFVVSGPDGEYKFVKQAS